ncbi:hypothetical protein JMJ35_000665 [Cladonia borealis]|uniref:Cytochrome P450 n=1 Tax=Cladonia borealis TaxID=184061 RepID=A0AA39R9V2_9LECA|nr:hypothetical protein JMJ35_000665 [Cladonia borealis]
MGHEMLVVLNLALASSLLLHIAYRTALPRPIPGIAYHKSSANSLFGVISTMLRNISSTNELFIRPFGRPMIFIADWRRRLLANTMSPAFLNQVAAPRIHDAALDLIELWQLKIKLAGNHPFPAPSDIHHMTLDAIWAATFGTSSGTTKSQVALLSSLAKLESLSPDDNIPAAFPKGPTPPAVNAIATMTDSLDNAIGSPLPRKKEGQRMSWGVKYLSDSAPVQQKLRVVLRAEFFDAAAARTTPSAGDYVKREISTLDAVMEEILRCSLTSHGAIRNAKVDTGVLGYRIPAGTDVYMLSNGPSFMSPGFRIEESRRRPELSGY